jgi:hypothetical protein
MMKRAKEKRVISFFHPAKKSHQKSKSALFSLLERNPGFFVTLRSKDRLVEMRRRGTRRKEERPAREMREMTFFFFSLWSFHYIAKVESSIPYHSYLLKAH